ncbi:hypothetical protein O181_023457 [Austropuccinia psidii MF-1]|uniref:Uncharacterized protein n=1 Tax=Austropuccinia psidii MF-1 TaxID=1389203 RepID=A0A9Q3CHE7_9BASI|nr:hypothetical protein [Austropuccinia psidii MF-1]
MSYKLTELADSSPSGPPPSVLCGSGILSWLASPWLMASSGHFDPGQTYDGYKAVEVLDPACTKCLAKQRDCFEHFNPKFSKYHFCFVGKKPCFCPGPMASNIRIYLWSKKAGPFEKELPISDGPTPDGTSGYSDSVPISRINTEGVVKGIRRIANCPLDMDAEGSDELDGEEVEVVNNPGSHQSRTSPSQPPAKRLQSYLIPSKPRNFQTTLATIPTCLPPALPISFHTRPAMNPEVIPFSIQQSRASPLVTSQQLQHEASSGRRI